MFRCCGAAAVEVEERSSAKGAASLTSAKSVLLMSNPRSNANTAWLKANMTEGAVEERYHMKRVLGKGAYASVWSSTHKVTGERFAVKEIDFSHVPPEKLDKTLAQVTQETQIHQKMKHKNIMQLHEFYLTRTKLYLVLELMRGGSLLDLILERGGLKEGDAKLLFRQVFEALHHMHSQNVIHRDIKLENIMLGQLNDLGTAKIADFGFAIQVTSLEDREKCTALAGTPVYLAPEAVDTMLGHRTVPSVMTPALDIWASGVALYMLVGGFPPFEGKTSKEIFRSIFRCIISFKAPSWRNVSDDCISMINALLTRDYAKRITAEEALSHKWVRQQVTPEDLSKTFVPTTSSREVVAESGFNPNKPPVAPANMNESILIKQSALLEIQQRHEEGHGMDHSLMRIFGENKLKVKSFKKQAKVGEVGPLGFKAQKSIGRTNSALATLMESVGPARFEQEPSPHPATHSANPGSGQYDTDSSQYSSSNGDDGDSISRSGTPTLTDDEPTASCGDKESNGSAPVTAPKLIGAAAAYAPENPASRAFSDAAETKLRHEKKTSLPGSTDHDVS